MSADLTQRVVMVKVTIKIAADNNSLLFFLLSLKKFGISYELSA